MVEDWYCVHPFRAFAMTKANIRRRKQVFLDAGIPFPKLRLDFLQECWLARHLRAR